MAMMLVSSVMKSTGGFLLILDCRTSLGFLKSPRRKMMNGMPAGIFILVKDELSVASGNKLIGVAVEVAADALLEVILADGKTPVAVI